MIVWASLGFSSRYLPRYSLTTPDDDALDLGVVEPFLVLRVELRLRHLHADDDRQALRGSRRRSGVTFLKRFSFVP